MNILTPNIRFDILNAETTLPNQSPITNIEILQHFPRTAKKSAAFHEKFAEKIQEELGFNTRYWCHKPWQSLDDVIEINAESLAIDACRPLFTSADKSKLEAFVLGSTTNKRYSGSQASAVLGAYHIKACAYDFKAGCSTSLASLQLSYSLMALGYQNVAVCCAETLSKVIDYNNEKTWLGVADGAAALWLRASPKGAFNVEKTFFSTDGVYVDAYTTRGLLPPTPHQIEKQGYTLQGDESLLKTLALTHYQAMIEAMLPTQKARNEVTWIIPHQVNRQLITQLMTQFPFPNATLLWDSDSIGNIGGASILYSLARAIKQQQFNKPGKLLMISVGGGLSYAAQLISVC